MLKMHLKNVSVRNVQIALVQKGLLVQNFCIQRYLRKQCVVAQVSEKGFSTENLAYRYENLQLQINM